MKFFKKKGPKVVNCCTSNKLEHSRTPLRQQSCNGQGAIKNFFNFTLLEVLLVMVIMSLLLAVAMPGFTSMMKGAGVEGGARNMCQTLKLARSHAINNRERVAVLMPKANLSDDFHNIAYRVCIINDDDSFKRWIPGENWEFLPTGTAIIDIDNDAGYDAGTPGGFSQATTITGVNCDDIGEATDEDLTGIVFRLNGRSLQEAHVVLGNIEFVLTSGTAATDSAVNIKIDQYTGRVSYGTD